MNPLEEAVAGLVDRLPSDEPINPQTWQLSPDSQIEYGDSRNPAGQDRCPCSGTSPVGCAFDGMVIRSWNHK